MVKANKFAMSSIFLGIISLFGIGKIFSGLVLAIIALVLGTVAIFQIKNGSAEGRPLAITGVVLSIVTIVFTVKSLFGL